MESSCMAIMMVLKGLANFGGGGEAGGGCFSRQRRMTDSSSTGDWGLFREWRAGSANWMARWTGIRGRRGGGRDGGLWLARRG